MTSFNTEMFPATAKAEQDKRFEQMLDTAIAATLARCAPLPPTSLDRFAAKAATARAAKRRKAPLSPVRLAPVVESKPVRCACERDAYALQVARAAEYNERRALDAPAWDVPEWVMQRAADVMAACPATIHFPAMLADTWLTLDATSSTDDDRIEKDAREYEDALAWASSHDDVTERWEGEYNSYESQARFVENLAEESKRALVALLVRLGKNPADPEIVRWVLTRIQSKRVDKQGVSKITEAQARLRGYRSCLASLARRFPAVAQAQ